MIKIKTKIINKDTNKETIGVSYKVKDTNNYEHLVLINHLLHQILDTNMYTKNELMKIVKMYLEKEG